jgi:hypothetical protein
MPAIPTVPVHRNLALRDEPIVRSASAVRPAGIQLVSGEVLIETDEGYSPAFRSSHRQEQSFPATESDIMPVAPPSIPTDADCDAYFIEGASPANTDELATDVPLGPGESAAGNPATLALALTIGLGSFHGSESRA